MKERSVFAKAAVGPVLTQGHKGTSGVTETFLSGLGRKLQGNVNLSHSIL